MDKDRVAGSAKQVKGAVKETIGKVVGESRDAQDPNRVLDECLADMAQERLPALAERRLVVARRQFGQ